MYKCGWNGCEKAYGTLNHLNAHVTMQSHGQKRTPEGKSIDYCVSFFSLPFPRDSDYPFVANGWIGLAPVQTDASELH
jgi:hypothetical protein